VTEQEEENGGSTPKGGKANAYWAKVRDEQIESEETGDGYTGAYRGVKPVPRGGAATVKKDDTIGAETRCWCGQMLGHSWPGKAGGAKHPKANGDTMPNTATGLDRRDLRAYARVLQDFVLHCVNGMGLKYRITNNSVILYPKDGTTPMTVPARNSDRQMRQLERWYQEHVKEPDGEVTPEDLARLAEAKNDKTEHPVKQQETPAEDEKTPRGQAYEVPPEPEVVVEMTDLIVSTNDEVWKAYVYGDGNESTHIITDGTNIRCVLCDRDGREYTIDQPRSIGGHNRMWHTDTSTLRTPEARDKALQTRRRRVMENSNITKAIDLLIEASGYNPGGVDEEKVEELEHQLAQAQATAADWQKKYEDMEAKLAIIREATGL